MGLFKYISLNINFYLLLLQRRQPSCELLEQNMEKHPCAGQPSCIHKWQKRQQLKYKIECLLNALRVLMITYNVCTIYSKYQKKKMVPFACRNHHIYKYFSIESGISPSFPVFFNQPCCYDSHFVKEQAFSMIILIMLSNCLTYPGLFLS